MRTILRASDFRRVEGTDRYTQVRHIPEDRIETGVYEVVPALVKGKLIAARVRVGTEVSVRPARDMLTGFEVCCRPGQTLGEAFAELVRDDPGEYEIAE